MKIKDRQNTELFDVMITSDAVHEEELMKSDFVKLSWNDVSYRELPVDAYVVPFSDGVEYSLLEPYQPEQKSESEWHYEPQFHHPKMYLSKVPFSRPSQDTGGNDITYVDWPYTGSVVALMKTFVDAINSALGLTEEEEKFGYMLQGFDDKVITVQFSSVDILSALTTTANTCECEWHIGWQEKTLYFGHITIDTGTEPPVLTIGSNVGITSSRNNKEGYWNAFEPQGSTRNIMRRSSSQEFVQSDVRLSLNRDNYPDGIIYTDGKGNVIPKAEFTQKLFLKPLIFEEVFPRQDMYVYKVRYREMYMKDEQGNKVVTYTDDEGTQHYLKYAKWYFRLAVPMIGTDGDVETWNDFALGEYAVMGVRSVAGLEDESVNYVTIETDVTWVEGMVTGVLSLKVLDREDTKVSCVCLNDSNSSLEYLTLIVYKYNAGNQSAIDALLECLNVGVEKVELSRGIDKSKFPSENIISQIIDGKEPLIAFQPNTYRKKTGTTQEGIDTYRYAESTPLAGLGGGDGEGHYGFVLRFMGLETEEYISKANAAATEEGDTGVVDWITGQPAVIDKYDYEIVFEQNDTVVTPSTKAQGIIPKGDSQDNANPSLFGNKVNIYNIAVSEEFEKAAQAELAQKTIEHIADQAVDKNSYTVKSNPVVFEQSNPTLFIGRKVFLDDGLNPSESDRSTHQLETRVMKLVTKLDFDFEQEITIGNEIIKGVQTQIKENIEAIVQGNAANSGTNISDSYLRTFLQNWVSPRFLSKISDDVAHGKITFAEGLISVLRAEFGEYVRSAGTNTGAAILPDGTGDFIDLVVRGIVSGGLDIRGVTKVVEQLVSQRLRTVDAQGREARKGFTDGYGVYIDALEGLIQTDGLEVRGFMRVMELVINRLQLMESDYSFTEGGTVEHIDVTANAQQMVFRMHKEHDNDTTPFYPGDILYAKVNDLLSHGSYYTAWVRVVSVDQTENTLTVVPYVGKLSDNTPVVPGSKNFTPLGTEITTEYLTALQADLTAYPDGYDKPMNLTRHGNVADGIDPATGQPSASILASQKGRQQSWVLSATDKRLSFFWNVDSPIIRDENYALCLGILPDLANLPSTRDRNMPSLYVNTVFFDHSHRANFPAQEVKTDRGAWTATPTALYDGSEVSDPYHYRHINQPTWLTYRNSPSWQSLTDEELLEKINTEFKEDLETSRVWRYGILWECLTEGTTEAPGYGCQHWKAVSGDTTYALEFSSSKGLAFRREHVNTVVTPQLSYGLEDITAKVAAEHWTWQRSSESGSTPQDVTWNALHAQQKSLTLTNDDMPDGWSSANKAIFTCSVTIGSATISNSIIS